MTLYYCLRFHTHPNPEDQVPVFITPRKRVAQVYPQALGSDFVASYDSQGYGGGIQILLRAGGPVTNSTWPCLDSFITETRHRPHWKHSFQELYICLRVCCGHQLAATEYSHIHKFDSSQEVGGLLDFRTILSLREDPKYSLGWRLDRPEPAIKEATERKLSTPTGNRIFAIQLEISHYAELNYTCKKINANIQPPYQNSCAKLL
jgi:hypothetical protein